MKACFNWPNNSDYLKPENISAWFADCKKRGLPTSLPWWAQSGFRSEELDQVLAASPDYLFILVNPDGKRDEDDIPLDPFIQAQDGTFWVKKYTEYNARLKKFAGKIVIVYDMECYSLSAKTPTRSSYPITQHMLLSRMHLWGHLVENILCDGLTVEESFWYGSGWIIPSINTRGIMTGTHTFDRVISMREVNFINMYWQTLGPSLTCFESSVMDATSVMLTQWCGGLKDFTTGKDRAATDKESITKMPQMARVLAEHDIDYVMFYGEEWPRFAADRTLFLDNFVKAATV